MLTCAQLMNSLMEEDQETAQLSLPVLPYPPQPQLTNNGGFPVSNFPMSMSPAVLPVTGESSSAESLALLGGPRSPNQQAKGATAKNLIRPIPVHPVPPSAKMADLNLNNKYSPTRVHEPLPLSLKLSTTTSSEEQSPTSTRSSTFQAMSSGSDSIISVA